MDPRVVPKDFANLARTAPASPAPPLSSHVPIFKYIHASGAPLSSSAAESYWTPASQIRGVTQSIPARIRIPGEGKSKISGKEDWEGETRLSEGDTDGEGDYLDWWGCRVCGVWWRTTRRIMWKESREEVERNTEEDRN